MSATDRTSIADWARHWTKDLIRFLTRRGASREEAQDFAQEVFLRILRVDDLLLVKNPKAYLFQIAKNLLLEWHMRAEHSHQHTAAPLAHLVAPQNPASEAEVRQKQRVVTVAIRRLQPLTSRILLLHVKQELPYEEISRRLGISKRMVKRHLLAGYSSLRQELAEYKPPRMTKDDI